MMKMSKLAMALLAAVATLAGTGTADAGFPKLPNVRVSQKFNPPKGPILHVPGPIRQLPKPRFDNPSPKLPRITQDDLNREGRRAGRDINKELNRAFNRGFEKWKDDPFGDKKRGDKDKNPKSVDERMNGDDDPQPSKTGSMIRPRLPKIRF